MALFWRCFPKSAETSRKQLILCWFGPRFLVVVVHVVLVIPDPKMPPKLFWSRHASIHAEASPESSWSRQTSARRSELLRAQRSCPHFNFKVAEAAPSELSQTRRKELLKAIDWRSCSKLLKVLQSLKLKDQAVQKLKAAQSCSELFKAPASKKWAVQSASKFE